MRLIKSIPTLTFMCALMVLVIMTAAMLALWVPYHMESYRRQTSQLEAELLDQRKQRLKEQVDRSVDFIRYMRSKTETRLQDEIKARVYEACDIALNIYREYRHKFPLPALEKMVKDALRPIRYNQGRGYFFATRLDGIEVLFADRPEMEGQDMSDVRDLDGRYVVPDMIAIVRAQGEGFYRYRWTMPGHASQGFYKIAFVKLFEPFEWLIGTGEYLVEVEQEIQAEVVERLETVRFAEGGYIFAGRYDGVAVTRPEKGRNMLEVTDANGVKIVRELIAAAKNGGGFVQYAMPPLEGVPAGLKISYVRGIPEWQWYVGAGLYIDDLKEMTASRQADLKRRLKLKVLEMLPVLLGAALLAMVVSWLAYIRIRKERDILGRFFKHAAEKSEAIDEKRLSFSEFRSLAVEANAMLAAREKAARDLQRSEERFKELAESLPETIFEIDLQGNITFVNRRAFEHFKYTQQDFAGGLNILDMIVPADHDRALKNMSQRLQQDMTGFKEYTALRKDGGTFPCLIFAVPVRHDGKPVGFRGFVIDITERKKAEDALQARERYYRSLISHLHEDILVVDRSFTIVDVNNAFLVANRRRREDVVGRHCYEITHGRGHPCRQYGEDCGMEAVFESAEAKSCTKEHPGQDGSRVVKDILYSPLKDDSGAVTHVIQAIRDVTDVVRVKDELRQSEEKFRLISNAAQDAIVMMDPQGKITYLNPAAERMFGYPLQEAIDADFTSLIVHERDRQKFEQGFTSLNETGGAAIAGELIEVAAVKKDHSEFPVELTVSGGNLGGHWQAILLLRDITKPWQAREALRKSEHKYRSLYTAMNEGVALHEIIYDEKGQAADYTLLDVNPSFESITGLKKESAVGRLASKLYGAGQAPYLDIYTRVAASGEPTRFETYFQPMDKHFNISVFALGNSRFATVFEDITERKHTEQETNKLEAQLRQAQKMEAIGTFAGGIAHDFNNILSAILGFTELALDKTSQNTPLHAELQEVFRAGLRARDLVKQILTFSRQAEQKMQPVQVDLIVKEALKFLRASLPANIQIQRNIDSKALVQADPTQLHQVLMNLCANAQHALRQSGGQLEVSLSEVLLDADFAAVHPWALAGAHLKLTVADNGEGMPPEVREKIFEPFFTTKGKEEGTGLGLAVVHGIVKSFGGFIKVYSEPGQGTAFNVFLPIIDAEVRTRTEAAGPLPAGSERVLLVDDEKILTDICGQMLERNGYRVTARTSSVEALALFKAKPNQFDLVVTDLTMPNLSGLELAAEIIGQRPEIPIILCTGFSEQITSAGAEAAGIKALILKPISRNELLRTARRVLDERK